MSVQRGNNKILGVNRFRYTFRCAVSLKAEVQNPSYLTKTEIIEDGMKDYRCDLESKSMNLSIIDIKQIMELCGTLNIGTISSIGWSKSQKFYKI